MDIGELMNYNNELCDFFLFIKMDLIKQNLNIINPRKLKKLK